MMSNRTPELIDAALCVLSREEHAALDCLPSLTKHVTKPGPVRLKKYRFSALHEYEAPLKALDKPQKRISQPEESGM
jgi:hypothetical protein